jgi:programmed cell death 6-interacting protein
MSLSDGETSQDIIPSTPEKSPLSAAESTTGTRTHKLPPPKSALGLPALNSNEWGFEEISLPPGPIDEKS